MSRVRTKRIYEPTEPDDGARILVMRFWPRGVKKDRIDTWLRELGAEPALLKDWKAQTVDLLEYRRRYLAGLEKPQAQAQLEELKRLVRNGPVTLLCTCPDETRCHRGILKQLLASSV